jgi:adenylyltransferase/sulfurtransferase
VGRLLRFNALTMSFKEHRIPRDPACPLCGANPTITQLQEITMTCSPGSDDMTVEELKTLRDRHADLLLVDVRNPDEFAICQIAGSHKLPLPELAQRLHELPKDKLIVLHCHHGGRSSRALQMLRSKGYHNVKNLAGGISAWAESIDPNVPQY